MLLFYFCARFLFHHMDEFECDFFCHFCTHIAPIGPEERYFYRQVHARVKKNAQIITFSTFYQHECTNIQLNPINHFLLSFSHVRLKIHSFSCRCRCCCYFCCCYFSQTIHIKHIKTQTNPNDFNVNVQIDMIVVFVI